MASTTPIETEYNYYYEPDFYNPPGSCINEFKDVRELIEYIDIQTQDCYAEINDFEESHTGKDGQVLDMVNMSVRNVYEEEVNLKIYDQHMSRTEIKYEIRQQLEDITAIFEQNTHVVFQTDNFYICKLKMVCVMGNKGF